MSPLAIFIYEIEEGSEPRLLADYFTSNDKLPPEAIEELSKKHSKLVDAVYKKGDFRYYSSIIQSLNLPQKKVYLGFVLKLDEDIPSLKGYFEYLETIIVKDFDVHVNEEKNELQNILKEGLTAILNGSVKIQEPIKQKPREKEQTFQTVGEPKERPTNYIDNKLMELELIADEIIKFTEWRLQENPKDKAKILKETKQWLSMRIGQGSIGPATAAAGPLLDKKLKELEELKQHR